MGSVAYISKGWHCWHLHINATVDTSHCSMTTVRGVNSSINIVWYSGSGTELQRVNGTTPTITNNLYVYMDTYRVSSQLNIDLNGKAYSCEAEIDSDPVIRNNNIISLDVQLSECYLELENP